MWGGEQSKRADAIAGSKSDAYLNLHGDSSLRRNANGAPTHSHRELDLWVLFRHTTVHGKGDRRKGWEKGKVH